MWDAIVVFTALYWFWPVIAIGTLIIGSFASDDRPGASLFVTGVLFALLYFTGHSPIENFTTVEIVGYAAAYVVLGVLWSILKWRIFVAKKLRQFKELKFNFIKNKIESNIKDRKEERQRQRQREHEAERQRIRAGGRQAELTEVQPKVEEDVMLVALRDAQDPGVVGLSFKTFEKYSKDQVINHVLPKAAIGFFLDYLFRQGYLKSRNEEVIPNPGNMKSQITTWMIWWPASILWDVLSDWLLRFWEHVVDALKEFFARMAKKMYGDVAAEFQNESNSVD